MSLGVIIFTVIYFALLCIYFFAETSGNLKFRAPVKCAMAIGFFVFACIEFNLNSKSYFTGGLNSYHIIFLAALFLAMLGDIFLLVDLNRGGDFFLAGNICFAIYYICLLADKNIYASSYWWIYLIALIVLIIIFVLFKFLPKIFKLGKMKGPMLFYLSSIVTHGLMGIVTIGYLGHTVRFLLLGLGSLLFMLSDFVLTTEKFVVNDNPKVQPWVLRLNSALYFTGLYLIVVSMVM